MDTHKLYGACGLYCGACGAYESIKNCHGCQCLCGTCFASYYCEECDIGVCCSQKGFDNCSECPDLPCTQLIQFTFDPIWKTHLPAIQNCLRIKKTGLENWLKEQEEYWKDEIKLKCWIELYERCCREYEQFEKRSRDLFSSI